MVYLNIKLILPAITELNFAFHVFIAGSSWSSCHENIFFKLPRNMISDRPTSGHRASGSYGCTGYSSRRAAQLHSFALYCYPPMFAPVLYSILLVTMYRLLNASRVVAFIGGR